MDRIFTILEEIRPEHDFRQSVDFVQDGLLDSYDIIQLVDMLEEEWSIVIDGTDLLPENFMNVKAILGLIKKSGGNIVDEGNL